MAFYLASIAVFAGPSSCVSAAVLKQGGSWLAFLPAEVVELRVLDCLQGSSPTPPRKYRSSRGTAAAVMFV